VSEETTSDHDSLGGRWTNCTTVRFVSPSRVIVVTFWPRTDSISSVRSRTPSAIRSASGCPPFVTTAEHPAVTINNATATVAIGDRFGNICTSQTVTGYI
jgi:hypothetical protein